MRTNLDHFYGQENVGQTCHLGGGYGEVEEDGIFQEYSTAKYGVDGRFWRTRTSGISPEVATVPPASDYFHGFTIRPSSSKPSLNSNHLYDATRLVYPFLPFSLQ